MENRSLLFVMFVILCTTLYNCHAKTVPGVGSNNTLTLGYLLSWSHEWAVGPYIGSAIEVAIKEIEGRQLLPGYNIEWILEDTWCQAGQGIKAATEAWFKAKDLDAFIGPGCSIVCLTVSLLAAAWNIPIVSYACTSDTLSDKDVYPTFSRLVGVAQEKATIIFETSEIFQWNRLGILTDSNESALRTAQQLALLSKGAGKETLLYVTESTTANTERELKLMKLRQVMRVLKSSCRVIALIMYSIDVRNVLAMAYEEDMLSGYVYIGPEGELPLDIYSEFRPDLGLEIYEGVIDLEISVPEGPEWDNFRQEVINSFQSPKFDGWQHIGPNASIDVVNSYAGLIHDAVLLWAYGVNKTLEQGHAPDDGANILRNIGNVTFNGISGGVAIDKNGDRKSDYTISMVQNGSMVPILTYNAAKDKFVKVYRPDNPQDWSGLLWPGNYEEVPKDSPACGWKNELCSEPSKDNIASIAAAASSAMVIIFLIVIISVCMLRRYRFEKELHGAASCVISWSEVEQISSSDLHASQVSEFSELSTTTNYLMEKHCQVVRYKSETLAVKPLGITRVNMTDRKVLIELKLIREIQHENLNPFIGICLDEPNACIFMLYASRGSLQDVMANATNVFTSDFKLSLAIDIARGMNAIHSGALGCHGHLTSSNCIVDTRWVCKITDYGLHHIRQSMTSDGSIEQPAAESLLWTAPELLGVANNHGSKKGDVYSYGIVIQELLLQSYPFSENEDLAPEKIVERIKEKSFPPYRPVIPEGVCSSDWLNLMTSCWNDTPNARPTFSKILSMLRHINGGADCTLVDSMIKRLEMHSTKLEEIVAQRSMQLLDEKDKLEHLLVELLPKSITDSLKLGRKVEPESFDRVTIFFSDVVSFTRISAAGTPMDVVKMLNLMYTVFDDIATQFDVYKVATIGDAYFVASGVPNRNGNKHATEISNMAIKMLEAISNLPIPHLPDEVLRLRIGIHTGPCLAGVVGVKMPRYLLFGDTVDIASQMESKGDAMRIHVSSYTEEILPKDEYKLQKRDDLIMVKGHGNMITYWLQHSDKD